MKETEITVQVFDSFDEINKKLKSQGFEMIEKFCMNDWYFSKHENVLDLPYIDLMNNSFLIRQMITDHEDLKLIYKQKKVDDFGNVLFEDKVYAKLFDLKNTIKIFKLAGLNNYCNVKNTSFVYKKDNMFPVVQIIDNLGIFIEYEETEDVKNLTANEKIVYMTQIVKNLGLTLGEDFSCKKVFMLLHK